MRINAKAYTSGNDIAFARGQSAPGGPAGRMLLAHVVQLQAGPSDDARQLVAAHVARVDVKANEITIYLFETGPPADQAPSASDSAEQGPPDSGKEIILSVPWSKAAAKRHREIIEPSHASRTDTRPIRAETRDRLVNSIARGRLWLSQIKSGAVSGIGDIAVREKQQASH